LPFLRLLRDKRGYETTYLVHWFREGNRQRSRILYVFRTPPGVRVGRDALDPLVIREIEDHYPEIEFDWRALLQNQQIVESSPEPRRPRRKREEDQPAAPVEVVSPTAAVETRAEAEPSVMPPEDSVVPPEEKVSDELSTAKPAPVPFPSTIEGDTPEGQIEWLRTWYPQIRERVPHRTHDPVRLEALFALTERLNPATWGDEAQVTAGLADAREALIRLSHVFSRRRRRSRRGGRRGVAPAAAPPTE
jgi:hypothetical protein